MSLPHPASYFLGCPVWAYRPWIGTVFPASTRPGDLLREYSRVFNTVEGNSFFYALPPMANIERWMAESADGFRFAPKFPKAISHERRLHGADGETAAFLKILDVLSHGERLGTSFLQLPPSFNINNIDTLAAYLDQLPKDFDYAVEPRHISFFDQAENEERLDTLLDERGIGKVIFDSRPLFSVKETDLDEEEAQSRKPNLPVRKVALGKKPFLRFVGCNDLDRNDAWIREWAPIINKWILENLHPYIMVHTADDTHAPFVAQAMHQQIQKLNPLLPDLPNFSDTIEQAATQPEEQLDLF